MANYLMPADGDAATAPGVARSRDDIISVNNMYRVKIYNKSGSIKFTGFIPPDFTFSLASSWTAPFGDTSVLGFLEEKSGWGGFGVADKALKFAGAGSMTKLASAKVWGGPSYLSIDLPIFVDAYYDTREEVVETTVNLLSLCAPTEMAGGLLIPPGPSPFKQVTAPENTQGSTAGLNQLDDAEAFTVDIGNFFTMGPCVVDSVNANFDNVWEDETGNPISVDFVLQVSSYFAVTREDLRKWLKLSQTSTSGVSTP